MTQFTKRCFPLLIFFALLLTQNGADAQQQFSSTAEKNMVATVHPAATAAGVAALSQGGNAIDAAVAAALTLGVVDGFNSGIGGGCFILLRTANGDVVAIDGREMAPAASHRDMYIRDGKADPSLSQVGPLAIGVPGALAAYEQAVSEHGKLNFGDLIRRAATVAEDGFEIDWNYAARLESTASQLSRFPASKQALLKTDGSIYRPGETLRQPDLAKTYRQIAGEGTRWFYQGEFARVTESWMKENGGILSAADFANYHTVNRRPIETTYRGHTIIGFPPPSSGGVHVAQILNILECFDIKSLYQRDPGTMYHVVAEAMKLAFADRAHWLGDPDFAKVPKGLIDREYAKTLASKIDTSAVTVVPSHGMPPGADDNFFAKHTTHISAADRAGNWVAITSTVNTTFGSKVVVPPFGVVMNNQMDDFSIAPGVPNAFGLVGNEANSVAPGKRPLSSMSPTIILKEGQPIMTVGAAGGPRIITQALLAIIRTIDLGQSLPQAVADPRIHHQWTPNRLFVEEGFPDPWVQKLSLLGHDVAKTKSAGITQSIKFDTERNVFIGVHDPRTPGKAAGSQ